MRGWSLVASLALALICVAPALAQEKEQEKKPVPKDSVALTLTGCLKGRMFTVTEGREAGSTAADLVGRSFRLAGKGPVMDEVKQHDKKLVEIDGIVRKADLGSQGPSTTVGRTRITVGAATPMGNDPARSPLYQVSVMDVTAVRFLSETCPIARQ